MPVTQRLWNNTVVTSPRSESFLRVFAALDRLFSECRAIYGEKIGL